MYDGIHNLQDVANLHPQLLCNQIHNGVHLCTSCLREGGETAGLLNPNGFQQNILAWKLLNGVVHITVAPFHKLLERGVEKCPWLTTCSELQQNIASV